jgi:hypothetical protein
MKTHHAPFLAACAAVLCMSAARAYGETAPPSPVARAENAIAAQGYSPSRLLALGRAQAQAGQLGPAIVSFERGLVLAPRDAGLRSELAHAEQAAGIAPEAQPWTTRALHTLSLREWTFAACGGALLLSLGMIAFVLAARLRALSGALLALGALVCGLGAVGVVGLRSELARALVLAPDEAVLQSPLPSASVVAHMRAGEAVQLHERHGDYVYIESDHGVRGWIQRNQVVPLLAPASPHT